jgi:hypothetical protein
VFLRTYTNHGGMLRTEQAACRAKSSENFRPVKAGEEYWKPWLSADGLAVHLRSRNDASYAGHPLPVPFLSSLMLKAHLA